MPRAVPFAELGSNSIKYHRPFFTDRRLLLRSRKLPWPFGWETVRDGRLGPANRRRVVDLLLGLRRDPGFDRFPAFATGMFRCFSDWPELRDEISRRTGIAATLLSGRDEAALLLDGIGACAAGEVTCLDIGSCSAQTAHRTAGGAVRLRSFPLGARAILARHDGAIADPDRFVAVRLEIEEQIRGVRLSLPARGRILGAGGTIEAAGRASGGPFSIREIRSLSEAARVGRFPSGLSASRREIFLSGLLVLEAFAEVLDAGEIEYAGPGVALGLASRLGAGKGLRAGGIGARREVARSPSGAASVDSGHPMAGEGRAAAACRAR